MVGRCGESGKVAGVLELALEMLTKLGGHLESRTFHWILHVKKRCSSNASEPPPASPFLLDLIRKIAPLKPHNPNRL